MKLPLAAILGANILSVSAVPLSEPSQWQVWMNTMHQLLDTPEKAIDVAEAIVRAAYGADQVAEERPFHALDLGDRWEVKGEGRGAHAMPFTAVSSTVTLSKKTGAVLDYRLSSPPSPELLEKLERLGRARGNQSR